MRDSIEMLKRFFIIPHISLFLLINFACDNGLKLPKAPSNLRVEAFSSSQIDLSWYGVKNMGSALEIEDCSGYKENWGNNIKREKSHGQTAAG